MVSGGITEIIWHFAGYLRIIHDIARDRVDYDETSLRNLQDDYVTARPDYVVKTDIDELDSRGIRSPEILQIEPIRAPGLPHLKRLDPLPSPDLDPDAPFSPSQFIPRFGGGGGAGGGHSFHITVRYETGGEQSLIEIKQHNFLLDDDELLFMVNGGYRAHDNVTLDAHINSLKCEANSFIHQMANDANAEIPKEWWFPQNSAGVIDFVQTHDAAARTNDGPDANSVDPGYYLNGIMQQPAPTPPDQAPPPDEPSEPDLGRNLGQWAQAGNNATFNAALIVDISESGRSMIVMGDYFKTNAIFQTNSIADRDYVKTGESDSQPAFPGANILAGDGNNVTDNIADFVQHAGLYEPLPVTFSGPRWNVEVVEGNYYNVHTIVQLNYLSDNDIVVQQGSDSHYEVHSGENELGNFAEVFNGTIQYDLIVVAGTYHGLNVIFQNNILLNNDVIEMIANNADPSQHVISGENDLTNTATIEIYGDNHFLPVNTHLDSIVDALGSSLETLDPSYGRYIDGSGGVFDVLYVRGDYYDINAIWQTNVISDANLILQLLEPPSAAALVQHLHGSETQSVTSGQNTLSNDAAIIDVGPTNTFVDGEIYGDTILVQANLVPGDEGRTLTLDMKALVPELIAFVNEAEDEPATPTPTSSPVFYEDPIASVMH